MHSFAPPGTWSSASTLRAAGSVIDAGNSRSCVRNGMPARTTNTASATAKVATPALRIEALHEKSDGLDLEDHARGEHQPGQDRAGAPRQGAHDQHHRRTEQR